MITKLFNVINPLSPILHINGRFVGPPVNVNILDRDRPIYWCILTSGFKSKINLINWYLMGTNTRDNLPISGYYFYSRNLWGKASRPNKVGGGQSKKSKGTGVTLRSILEENWPTKLTYTEYFLRCIINLFLLNTFKLMHKIHTKLNWG